MYILNTLISFCETHHHPIRNPRPPQPQHPYPTPTPPHDGGTKLETIIKINKKVVL